MDGTVLLGLIFLIPLLVLVGIVVLVVVLVRASNRKQPPRVGVGYPQPGQQNYGHPGQQPPPQQYPQQQPPSGPQQWGPPQGPQS